MPKPKQEPVAAEPKQESEAEPKAIPKIEPLAAEPKSKKKNSDLKTITLASPGLSSSQSSPKAKAWNRQGDQLPPSSGLFDELNDGGD